MSEERQVDSAVGEPQDMRTESVMARRYASPRATAIREVHPKPVSFIGLVLYLAFAVAIVAAAFEVFPLGSSSEADTNALGGIVGAYTWGRYSRNRWAGFGIGLLVSFLVIGLAIAARHAGGN